MNQTPQPYPTTSSWILLAARLPLQFENNETASFLFIDYSNHHPTPPRRSSNSGVGLRFGRVLSGCKYTCPSLCTCDRLSGSGADTKQACSSVGYESDDG
eukprot:GHVT01020933.1.p1 GENE.GHVT01020933.1~~GHVT01020933.1.p1  ORF type:complete len:100 (+),score=6.03 GHVT01020933.1:778-1077(+)